LTIKTTLKDTQHPVNLCIEGRAKIGKREMVHEAIPAEDRMQAFLWRHLVPADELKTLVVNPSYQPPTKRIRRALAASKSLAMPPAATSQTSPAQAPKPPLAAAAPSQSPKPAGTATTPTATTATAPTTPAKPKFTKQQVVGRLRQLKILFEDGLLTDEFYDRKVAECEASM
jgi:hypothetical protein